MQTPHKKIIINSVTYEFVSQISSSEFATVHKIIEVQSQRQYALKIISDEAMYKREKSLYKMFRKQNLNQSGMPNLIDYGSNIYENQLNFYLILELYGPSLNRIQIQNQYSDLDIDLVLRVGSKILQQIQFLHNLGFYHRDIKIDNILFDKDFTLDLQYSKFDVYLIDFGLAIDIETSNSQIYRSKQQIVGNEHFISLDCQLGNPYSFKDDLESWFYTLVFFAKGFLPWTLNRNNSVSIIKQMKLENYKSNIICKDLPPEFLEIFKYIKQIQSLPDYQFLYKLLEPKKFYPSINVKCFVDQEINFQEDDSEHIMSSQDLIQNSCFSLNLLESRRNNMHSLVESEFHNFINQYSENNDSDDDDEFNSRIQIRGLEELKIDSNHNQRQKRQSIINQNKNVEIQKFEDFNPKFISKRLTTSQVNEQYSELEISDEFDQSNEKSLQKRLIFKHNSNDIRKIYTKQ